MKNRQFLNGLKTHNDNELTVGHHDDLGGGMTCNQLIDVYFKWLLTLPTRVNPTGKPTSGYENMSGGENQHFFRTREAAVYFAAVSPGRKPDRARIVMTKQSPLLIGMYWVETSTVENPSRKTTADLMDLILNDLAGIQEINATLNGKPIWGCLVIRDEPLSIKDIPVDNIIGIPRERLEDADYTIDIVHGGAYLLLKAENFTSGDHLIKFNSRSKNYELEGEVQVSALV